MFFPPFHFLNKESSGHPEIFNGGQVGLWECIDGCHTVWRRGGSSRDLWLKTILCSEMFSFVFSTECFCLIPKLELKSRKGKSFYAWQEISVTKSTGTTENFEMQRAPVQLTKEKDLEEVQDFVNNWQPQLGSNAFEESSLIPKPQQPKQLALEDAKNMGSGIPQFTFPASSSACGSAGVPLPSGSKEKIDDALSWLAKAKDACNLVLFIHFSKFPLYDLNCKSKKTTGRHTMEL